MLTEVARHYDEMGVPSGDTKEGGTRQVRPTDANAVAVTPAEEPGFVQRHRRGLTAFFVTLVGLGAAGEAVQQTGAISEVGSLVGIHGEAGPHVTEAFVNANLNPILDTHHAGGDAGDAAVALHTQINHDGSKNAADAASATHEASNPGYTITENPSNLPSPHVGPDGLPAINQAIEYCWKFTYPEELDSIKPSEHAADGLLAGGVDTINGEPMGFMHSPDADSPFAFASGLYIGTVTVPHYVTDPKTGEISAVPLEVDFVRVPGPSAHNRTVAFASFGTVGNASIHIPESLAPNHGSEPLPPSLPMVKGVILTDGNTYASYEVSPQQLHELLTPLAPVLFTVPLDGNEVGGIPDAVISHMLAEYGEDHPDALASALRVITDNHAMNNSSLYSRLNAYLQGKGSLSGVYTTATLLRPGDIDNLIIPTGFKLPSDDPLAPSESHMIGNIPLVGNQDGRDE